MHRIAKQLHIKYEWYVTISRGGLQPTLMLSQITGQYNIDTICVRSYDNKSNKQGTLEYTKKDLTHLTDKSVLVIDDLVDTGQTLQFVVDQIALVSPYVLHTAVMYVKPKSVYLPTFYIKKLPTNDFIIFPWELYR